MIEFSQLFYFRTVARLQHVTKAAEELHVSQPNLSNAMSRLEDTLGVPLFERSHGKIRLGEYGKIYLDYVEQALNILDVGEKKIQALYHQEQQFVQVASCSFTFEQHACLSRFLQDHPHTNVSIQWLSHGTILRMLEANEVDFAVTSKPEQMDRYDWIPLLKYEVYIGVSENHRFCGRNALDISEIKDEGIVVNNLGADRTILSQIFGQAGYIPKVSFCTNDDRAVGEKLQQEKELCMIPDACLYDVLNIEEVKHVHPIRLLGVEPYYTIGILKRKDHTLSAAAQEMVDMIVNEFPVCAKPCQAFWKDYWAQHSTS